ncbi:hypothetical protein [Rhizobium leguminosarum]|uniref:hypothetical protein n=1 Tax=Rhizobium leguminosarum TaxID=384 RepID=UPI002E154029|nr:hypothetical protein U8Q02_42815 [Rhizobium leguminosarum]
MDHAAKLSSAALVIFDEELRDALAPIATFAGLESLPLVVKSPALTRSPARIDVEFLFATSIYTRRFAGHPTNAENIPAMSDPAAFVKEQADARFKQALDADFLRGKVRGQTVGRGAHLVCDEAYALTRINCGCGNGTVACHGCGGDGAVVCSHCQFFADWRGRVKCWACHGLKGSEDTEGKWHNCATCGGHGLVYCRNCGGSQKERCGGCGGRGEHTCSTCSGHAFVTDVQFFKIDVSVLVGNVATKAPAHVVEHLKAWVHCGLASHASERENPIYPWSDFATAKPTYGGWQEGVYRATLPLACEVTHAELEADYRGGPAALAYVRVQEPKFSFPNFLDIELDAISAKTEELSKERPAKFLKEIANVKGLALAIGNLVVTTDAWREKWVQETAGGMKGAVSHSALDRIARHYVTSLKSYEKKMVSGSFVSMAPVVACIAFAAWYFGVFDWSLMVGRDARIGVFVLFGLVFASVTIMAVTGSARGRVARETGNPSFLGLGWRARIACAVFGFMVAHVGMTAAVQHW